MLFAIFVIFNCSYLQLTCRYFFSIVLCSFVCFYILLAFGVSWRPYGDTFIFLIIMWLSYHFICIVLNLTGEHLTDPFLNIWCIIFSHYILVGFNVSYYDIHVFNRSTFSFDYNFIRTLVWQHYRTWKWCNNLKKSWW